MNWNVSADFGIHLLRRWSKVSAGMTPTERLIYKARWHSRQIQNIFNPAMASQTQSTHSPWRIPQSSFRWESFSVSAQQAVVVLLLKDSRRSHEWDREEWHESASGEGCASANMVMFAVAKSQTRGREAAQMRSIGIDGVWEGKCSIFSCRWGVWYERGLRFVSLYTCSTIDCVYRLVSNLIIK